MAERKIVSKFGGRRVVGSGSLSGQFIGLSGDVVIPKYNLLIQSKTKMKSSDNSKIKIEKSWIDKHWHQASVIGRIPALFFSFSSKNKFWAIFDANHLKEKEITQDNTIKANNKSVVVKYIDLLKCPLFFSFPNENIVYCIDEANDFLDLLECYDE